MLLNYMLPHDIDLPLFDLPTTSTLMRLERHYACIVCTEYTRTPLNMFIVRENIYKYVYIIQ